MDVVEKTQHTNYGT